MTITVKLDENKADLSELLTLVEAGQEVVISRYGKPIARMVAMPDAEPATAGFTEEERARRRAVIDAILEFRKTMPSATAEEIDEWKREGRR
jgi:prevent-host-death family protein